MLKKEILNCDESIAKGFDIHVIDNGRTLNPPNKNAGGAGSFAVCQFLH